MLAVVLERIDELWDIDVATHCRQDQKLRENSLQANRAEVDLHCVVLVSVLATGDVNCGVASLADHSNRVVAVLFEVLQGESWDLGAVVARSSLFRTLPSALPALHHQILFGCRFSRFKAHF